MKVRFADFTTRTVQRTLPSATDNETVIAPLAEELVRSVWNPGVGVRLLGVGVTGLDDMAEQLDLFEAAEDSARHESADDRARRLARGMDAVRERFGEDAIVRGSKVAGPKTTGTPASSIQPDDIADDS